MSDLVCLGLGVLLWIAHVLVQAFAGSAEFGLKYLLSPRDKQPAAKGVAGGRATRALNNYTESFVPFVGLALALITTGKASGLGATIWIIARILYLPAYVMGVTYVRTALWGISVIGLLMMLARLAFAS
ncbi:MAG TPA: MAPEG family protein [Roseiarcus sp.]|jgi:uncharacterized MAPEG superfamily protein|nr:MAPEG family protein [Roseiarcus sp.]